MRGLRLTSIASKAKTAYDAIVNVSALLGAVILVFVMLSVCAEIVMRYFFDKPIIWVIEISEYSLLLITFLASGWVLTRDAHISVDIVTRHFKDKAEACLGIISSAAGIIVSCVLIRYGVSVTWEYFLSGSFRPTSLEVPTFLILWVIPFGSVLLLTEFLRKIYKHIKSWKSMQDQEEIQGS
jgi:TRAP-type C4-dicarboxylate transport system permease small subunit